MGSRRARPFLGHRRSCDAQVMPVLSVQACPMIRGPGVNTVDSTNRCRGRSPNRNRPGPNRSESDHRWGFADRLQSPMGTRCFVWLPKRAGLRWRTGRCRIFGRTVSGSQANASVFIPTRTIVRSSYGAPCEPASPTTGSAFSSTGQGICQAMECVQTEDRCYGRSTSRAGATRTQLDRSRDRAGLETLCVNGDPSHEALPPRHPSERNDV